MKKSGRITGIVIIIGTMIVALVVGSIASRLFMIHDDTVASFRYWPVLSIIAVMVMVVVGQFMYNLESQKRNRVYETTGVIVASIVEVAFIVESGAYVISRYGLGMLIGVVIFAFLYAVILWGVAETVSRCRIRHIKRTLATRA